MSAAWSELRSIARTLPPLIAEQIGREWARDAQFEHASIASFGRFALELLAVAAPSELIEGAHRAAIDEIEHARRCFSLAAIYCDEALGPGPLPLDSTVFAAPTLAGMVHAAVLEGCVNETLAALEAQVACRHAEPQAVRDVLSAIERQESDHAALAFRFVSWAIASGGEALREVARGAFTLAGEQLQGVALARGSSTELDAELRRHGRIPEHQRSELRRRALHEVIEPAARTLLG